jgi:hypothetical protein
VIKSTSNFTVIWVAEMWSVKRERWVPINGVRFSEDWPLVEQWLADYQKRRKKPSQARIRPYISVNIDDLIEPD